jgi:hypothetical protein
MPATLEDIVLLLANHLIEQNRDKLAEVHELLRGHSHVLEQLNDQLGDIMSINESNQNALNEIAGTLNTEFAEVAAQLDALEQQEGAEAMDFSGIRTAVQSVADKVSNAVPDVDPIVVDPSNPDTPA